MGSVKIYYFGQNEQVIAQAIDIFDNIRAYLGLLGEGIDASLGTAADGAADMTLGCGHSTSRQYEPLRLGKGGIDGIDALLKQRGLALRQPGRGIEGCLALVGGEVGANVEEVVLHAQHHCPLFLFGAHHGYEESEV